MTTRPLFCLLGGVMMALLFLLVLNILPSLVVPIHNSSTGGNLCMYVCARDCAWDDGKE